MVHRKWYSIRWYGKDDQEHWWCGGWCKEDIEKEAKEALTFSYVARVSIFEDDRCIETIWR